MNIQREGKGPETLADRDEAIKGHLLNLNESIRRLENILAPLTVLEALIERISAKQERIEEEQRLFRNFVYECLSKKVGHKSQKRSKVCEDVLAWNYPTQLSGWNLFAKKEL